MKLRPEQDQLINASPITVSPARRLRVGVLVDLPHNARPGGHVRSWERLAQAALELPDRLDLTVHFSGAAREVRALGDNVRFVFEPPVFSTNRLPFLSHVPDHTDLAPWHWRLGRRLAGYDVIHTTDAYFAYARTAHRVARKHGIPLVTSVHTNTPEYARVFTAQTIERLAGGNGFSRLLIDRLGLPRRVEAKMVRRLHAHQRACAAVLVSRPAELDAAMARTGGRAALLERGIDRKVFSPARRDRAWLEAAYGIPAGRVVILFVGRVNRGKNLIRLVEAMRGLLAAGLPVHLLCAGEGDDRAAIAAALGGNATCPGYVDPDRLARLYASADWFAFPSKIEECANVVFEALSSGLPVSVAAESGMSRFVAEGETGYALPGDRTESWVANLAMVACDCERRRAMSRAARVYAERQVPSWTDILAGTLLPVWRRVAAEAEGR